MPIFIAIPIPIPGGRSLLCSSFHKTFSELAEKQKPLPGIVKNQTETQPASRQVEVQVGVATGRLRIRSQGSGRLWEVATIAAIVTRVELELDLGRKLGLPPIVHHDNMSQLHQLRLTTRY